MRLCSVASGSSGNCIYAGTDTTHLLVDVGISGKRTEAGLNELGVSMRDIDGILVTHEHSDHIAGLGVLARKYGTPIYATNGTIRAIHILLAKGQLSLMDMDIQSPYVMIAFINFVSTSGTIFLKS